MRSVLEVESKLELSRLDFERLLGRGQIKKAAEQLNVYYDCEWRLASSSSTLRIRLASGRVPVVTLKIPVHTQDGRRTSREIEVPTAQALIGSRDGSMLPRTINVQENMASDFRSSLIQLGISTLYRVGYMRNKRHVVEFAGLGTVELDWARLPNGNDFYEAEIENSDLEEHRRLVDFIRQTVPGSRPSKISKFERFQRAVIAKNNYSYSPDFSTAGGI